MACRDKPAGSHRDDGPEGKDVARYGNERCIHKSPPNSHPRCVRAGREKSSLWVQASCPALDPLASETEECLRVQPAVSLGLQRPIMKKKQTYQFWPPNPPCGVGQAGLQAAQPTTRLTQDNIMHERQATPQDQRAGILVSGSPSSQQASG
ncbi:hypothetical protein AOQ84DRAFT_359156 [Glonium stellatum]|uniref:Uncharacterized protein n=1 Tax=Glonium stellatum TaxID=574774 RepID=A0A8E2FBX2_9PEZI|nr:hypothetical protein AOQ84DRAFT_359156 [Glonium stellatum]